MAAKKKKVDPIKQREKRTKIAAVVGVVVLVIAAAYEIPSMLAVMNKKPPTGTTYDPGPSLTPGGLPNVAGGATPTGAASTAGQLVDTDIPPVSGAGQLVTFSVFESKNPFAPQVTAADASTSTSTSTAAGAAGTGAGKAGADVPPAAGTTTTPVPPTITTPTPPGVTPSQPPASSTGVTSSTTTPAVASRPSVAISVNGVVSHVSSEGTFPSGAPVFRLASWTTGSAKVAIVGGSYATGDGTLTLHVGQAVTLQNQTDGKRYKLELLSTP